MKRIQLGNTVFEGQNDVYVLGTGSGETTTLIDTGVATPDVREQLQAGLADYGVEFADVDAVFLTHWHHDHSALAGEIQAESDATVYAHPADAPLVEQDEAAVDAMQTHQRTLFDAWGMPAAEREELLDFLEVHERIQGEPPTVEPIEAGDRFDLGAVELEVVHLPGHAAGLVGFAFDGEKGREIFIGDALLPRYTPNVGGADVRVESPLEKYLTTLRSVVDEGYERAWPGHRDAITDPTGRAVEIMNHHRERTGNVLDVLAEHGPADAWTVSAHLFGDLENIHIMHGPGEAYAHLDHLERRGVVTNTADGYALEERDPDLDALFPRIPDDEQ